MISIEPEAVRNAGAQWRRTGTSTWYNSGARERIVPVGAHTVEFKDGVEDWAKPANIDVTIRERETTSATATYTYCVPRITGKIINQCNSQGISGVLVSIGDMTTTTNAEGSYTIRADVGTHTVTFSKADYQTRTHTGVTVNPCQVTTLDTSLTLSISTITGQVISQRTLEGVSGVTVAVGSRSTTTGSAGNYTLTADVGTHAVSFSRSGYQTQTATGIRVVACQTTSLDMILFPGSTGPLNIETQSRLGPAEKNRAYRQVISISGGTYPYTFAMVSGTRPAGLALDAATGLISGAPTATGVYTFAIRVTDAQNVFAEREFSIEVTDPLTMTTPSPLPRGMRGSDYFHALQVSGGTRPYNFSRTGGSLPGNVSLSSSGQLSGPPSSTGDFTFTVRVTDASGRTTDTSLTLSIDAALTITTSRLNDGITGQEYRHPLAASGGFGDYTWSVFSGALPNGIILNAGSGVLSGRPSAENVHPLVFAVTDQLGRTAYRDFSLQVCHALRFVSAALPDGLLNTAYSDTVRTSGGIGPYRFSFTGQLPPGLNLNSSTGIISGTPTGAGLVNVAITVSDSTHPEVQTRTQNFSIRITSDLTILTAAVLPNARVGEVMNPVVLAAGGGVSPYTWRVAGSRLPNGVGLNAGTGTLSGTPSVQGDFVFTLEVKDARNATATKEFVIHISETLRIVTGALPDGAQDESYSVILTARGGLQPYTWRIISGSLPSGLTLNLTTGVISGRPTTRQMRNFTVEVSDSLNPAEKATREFTLEILDELFIATPTLPHSRVQEAYTATLTARQGRAPYSWRLDSGTLPPGLRLTSSPTTATLAGTPTRAGSYTFTIEVRDSATPVNTATRTYTVEVYGPVSITTTGLKSVFTGQAYRDAVVVSGGQLPYTWSITAGNLPTGLNLNPTTGDITGTTQQPAGYSTTVTVRVTDAGNPAGSDEKTFTLQILTPLSIPTEALPGGLEMRDYQFTLRAAGGVAPYTWSVVSGSLPPDLTLNPATGQLRGFLWDSGTFNISIRVRDAAPVANQAVRAFTLTVTPCTTACNIIGGKIEGLEGVTIQLSGSASASTTTDARGQYLFGGLENGTYTVTPSRRGHVFQPESRTLTLQNANRLDVNFDYERRSPGLGGILFLLLDE